MSEGVQPRNFGITREWFERTIDRVGDEGEISVGGHLFASVVPPNAMTQTVDPFISPSYVVPFNPMDDVFPRPADIWPFTPSPITPPFIWHPVDVAKDQRELAELLKRNSERGSEQDRINTLTAEVARLKDELYFIRHAKRVLHSSLTWPKMLKGPFPVRDESFEIDVTAKATVLHNRLTLREWESMPVLDVAHLILEYVRALEADPTLTTPPQYQENLAKGKYQ